VPEIATVDLAGGFRDNDAIGAQEERAGFRHKLKAWRVLRYSGPIRRNFDAGTREVWGRTNHVRRYTVDRPVLQACLYVVPHWQGCRRAFELLKPVWT
jgi:hypothetical protein